MLIGTHALLPVSACLAADHVSLLAGRDRVFPVRALWWVAGFGMLPDLCSPHIMLEDRHTSGAHSVWFLAVIILPAWFSAGFFSRGQRFRIAMACWLATAAHLAADAVSGGIAWLYPWKDDVIGRFFIDLDWWAWSDGLFVLLAWILLRSVPHMEARNIRRMS